MKANRKLLVFISSTYKDLKVERQSAVEAVLKAGHIPAGMELFTAGDQSQLQTIYRWIDQCDVYMLILGGRYGSVETESGLSYTELEYDYARSTGKPTFAVVASDAQLDAKVRDLGRDGMEQVNPALLAEFRRKVLSNISSFFTDSKDIKLCVYESLGELSLDPNLSGWVAARDVPDSGDLLRQIEELRSENLELRTRPAAVSGRKPHSDETDFSELKRVLESIRIVVPAMLYEDEEDDVITDLFSILKSNSDTLVSGLTSSTMIGDAGIFFYRNVLPKLMIHGLAENEKITGSALRRSFVNKKGQEFLAWELREALRNGEP